MFKKIILFFVFCLSILSINNIFASCTYNDWDWPSRILKNCKPDNVVWDKGEKFDIWWENSWFKKRINTLVTNISLVLWVLAVWSLVYAWFLFQFSAWEDEKIKKAKDIFKWTIIWFLWLISASWIIYIVINLIYSLAL